MGPHKKYQFSNKIVSPKKRKVKHIINKTTLMVKPYFFKSVKNRWDRDFYVSGVVPINFS